MLSSQIVIACLRLSMYWVKDSHLKLADSFDESLDLSDWLKSGDSPPLYKSSKTWFSAQFPVFQFSHFQNVESTDSTKCLLFRTINKFGHIKSYLSTESQRSLLKNTHKYYTTLQTLLSPTRSFCISFITLNADYAKTKSNISLIISPLDGQELT